MIDAIVNKYKETSRLIFKLNKWYVREGQTNAFANEYLLSRGFTKDICDFFGIGFAPSTSKTLEFLSMNQLPIDPFVEAGIIKKDYNLYDRFSERITFLIKDLFNNAVGFTGRVFQPHQEHLGKYVNSEASFIFQKALLLYNLGNAIPFITQKKYAVLVEGNADVVSLYKCGLRNVVSPGGTSLTEEQCKLLKIYTKNVIIWYDNDEAGIKALSRIVPLLQNEQINCIVVNTMNLIPPQYYNHPSLPIKDPDDFVKLFGVQHLDFIFSSYNFT